LINLLDYEFGQYSHGAFKSSTVSELSTVSDFGLGLFSSEMDGRATSLSSGIARWSRSGRKLGLAPQQPQQWHLRASVLQCQTGRAGAPARYGLVRW